jgi:hypothetical protein
MYPPAYPSQPMYPGQPGPYSQPMYPPGQPMMAPMSVPMYPGMPMPVPDQGGGMAIASLVLGIISLPAALAPICGVIFGGLAIIFGALGLKSTTKRGLAIAGLVMGIVALALAAIFFLVSLANYNSSSGY